MRKKNISKEASQPAYMSAGARKKLSELSEEAANRVASKHVERGEVTGIDDRHDNAPAEILERELQVFESRAAQLRDLLSRAQIVEPNYDTSRVSLGVWVEVNMENPTEKPPRLTVSGLYLGAADFIIHQGVGIISHQSPLGQAIEDKKIGETAEIKPNTKITVTKIRPGIF